MNEERRARLRELLAQHHYREALDDARDELTRLLGVTLTDDDAVTKEAVAAALAAVAAQDRFHLVWHRVWGVRLRSEVLDTCARLADALDGERAVLVWSGSTVGFVVPVALALRTLPGHLGPGDGGVGPGGFPSDLLLVADDGASGLRLEYTHYSNSDEYELRSWGRFAIAVV